MKDPKQEVHKASGVGTFSVDGFEKRDGMVVPFNIKKIEKAVYKASLSVARRENREPEKGIENRVGNLVLKKLNDPNSPYFIRRDHQGKRIAKIEEVQDLVEVALAELKKTKIMITYKNYRRERHNARTQLRIRTKLNGDHLNSTDSLLLVESTSGNMTYPWDKSRIARKIVQKTALSTEKALEIAKAVENKIFQGKYHTINTTLIREMVNNELSDREYNEELKDLKLFSIPKSTIEKLIFSKANENSNIKNNNPEAVSQTLSEIILKHWALQNVFGPQLERAHARGRIHIHDLGFPTRVYCSSHSLEYLKKYGLTGLENLSNESKPAKSAQVLTGHLNTFLASMQAYYAGALGIGYINILYAPLLKGASERELEQRAQELIFNGSQNAFSRGGQTIFLDFNIHSGIPKYLSDIPAIGPGGKYMLKTRDRQTVALTEVIREKKSRHGNPLMELRWKDRVVLREIIDARGNIAYDKTVEDELQERGESIVTYRDYQKTARRFAQALLKIWERGDKNGKIFAFPKCDFHVSEESFDDPEQNKILKKACQLASVNGSTYFIFDRDQVTLSACCRLRTTIHDNYMLMHPESMRFCGFQNVTINIPQSAYLAAAEGNKTLEGALQKIHEAMDLALEAHLRKKESVREMMQEGGPLWQIGKEACDGRVYVNLEESTYIIGILGLNDAVKFLTGFELHENPEALDMGIKIIASMNLKTQEYSEKHKLKFTLEETPAESAARRLAKTDLQYFPQHARQVLKGDLESGDIYYTNSVHIPAEASTGIVHRIKLQGLFHGLIESGAITHAFIGEEKPSAESIYRLVKNAFYKTQSAQMTISPEFTYCNQCKHQSRGLLDICPECQSDDVSQMTRVVGYFSEVKNMNRSKQKEIAFRQKGNYGIGPSPDPS